MAGHDPDGIMIVVVTGPPCGGKSTYVRTHVRLNDIVIDMDTIAMTLEWGSESHAYTPLTRHIARAARNAAVGECLKMMQGERRRTAYIIHTDPPPEIRRTYRAFGARFVDCDPGKDVCLERLQERPDENRVLVRQLLDDYYARRI